MKINTLLLMTLLIPATLNASSHSKREILNCTHAPEDSDPRWVQLSVEKIHIDGIYPGDGEDFYSAKIKIQWPDSSELTPEEKNVRDLFKAGYDFNSELDCIQNRWGFIDCNFRKYSNNDFFLFTNELFKDTVFLNIASTEYSQYAEKAHRLGKWHDIHFRTDQCKQDY